MLGNRRNRCRLGAVECQYGCCRAMVTGSKKKTNRILRTRENARWKKEARDGFGSRD